MQTALADFIRATPAGAEADRILRACVHCGFCTATCPTYQLLGDELDGPRGRIYQIKQVLEGDPATPRVQTHLDRCLTCRACETTCPSGVRYGRLLEIGRHEVDRQVPRPWPVRVQRWLLRALLSRPGPFAALLALGRLARPLLGQRLAQSIPPRPKERPAALPSLPTGPVMMLLEGCVQPALAPEVNDAARRVLGRLGIRARSPVGAGCCGALRLHLDDPEGARRQARRNIDAWWPDIMAGAEAIVASSSACALMLKDYGPLLEDDPDYRAKAQRVAELARDLSQVLADQDLSALPPPPPGPVAFHAPCTLQHGQRLGGLVEGLLGRWGLPLTPVPDAHLCCGSAGTYSLLQAELSGRLREAKLQALQGGAPGLIATANIGCLAQLRQGAQVPVVHWIQLMDPPEAGGNRAA